MKRRSIIVWGFDGEYHNQASGNPIASYAYVHAAYSRAFRYMGHDVAWVNDSPKAEQMVKAGDVLFVMDCRCEHVPIRDDCFYVTHNCYQEKFKELARDKVLGLQVFTEDAMGEELNPWTFYAASPEGRVLFQPWATDLLPHEFKYEPVDPTTKVVNWVGSIWNCEFNRGNFAEIEAMRGALARHQIKLENPRCLDKDHARLIRESHIAPSVQGQWQVDVKYLPCRLWKNVSYGQMAITNNKMISEILPSVYSNDIDALIDAALKVDHQTRMKLTAEAMRVVKNQHTYVNRARRVLECLFDR